MPATDVIVEIYASPNKQTKTGRPQRWRWRAVNAGNHKKMATSGEAYSNRQDCIDAIMALFGDGPQVRLTQPDEPDVILREMVE